MGDFSTDFALSLFAEMLWTAIYVGLPILGFSMLVGLLVSIFQVVTQIQEVSLTFIPKLITVAVVILVLGPWMLGKLIEFATVTIRNIPMYF